jgi:ArsR family transcriptional regulator, arsenate/arsenite/antimonite-responsive transcriptional repressor
MIEMSGGDMSPKDVVAALAALAHEHRLALYRLLVEAGPTGLTAGVIAEQLGVAPSSLTFHTQALVRAGLATQRRMSRQLIYAADFTAMNDLVGYLTEKCCGRDVVCALACDPSPAAVAAPRRTRKKSA